MMQTNPIQPPTVEGGQQRQKKDNLISLYVGDIDEKVYDIQLFKFFERHGLKPVKAKIVLDKKNKTHRGFGFVSFLTKEQAQAAMDKLNNVDLEGKPLRIMWPFTENFDKEANVLFKNVAESVSQKQITELFAKYGKILSCKIDVYKDGTSRGFGYIQFEKKEEADAAIAALNHFEVNGKKLEVLKLINNEHRNREEKGHFNNLFVRGLREGTTDEELKAIFLRFGDIQSAKVAQKEGVQQNHGYVNFVNHEAAKKAVDELHMKKTETGEVMFVQKFLSKKEVEHQKDQKQSYLNSQISSQNVNTLVVKGHLENTTEEEIVKAFTVMGPVLSCKLVKKDISSAEGNYQKTLAYVMMEHQHDAQKCIQNLDGSRVLGFPIKVDFWRFPKDLKEEAEKQKLDDTVKFIRMLQDLQIKGTQEQYQQQNPMYQQNRQQMQYQNNNMGRGRGGHQQYQQQQHYGGRGQAMGMPAQNPGQMGFPMQQMPPPQMAPAAGGAQLDTINYNKEEYKQAEAKGVDEVKNFVGTLIYHAIAGKYGEDNAGKITGMLLEQQINHVQYLDDSKYLSGKAYEALVLLQKAQQAAPVAPPQ